jgi:hypothetical protein
MFYVYIFLNLNDILIWQDKTIFFFWKTWYEDWNNWKIEIPFIWLGDLNFIYV